MRLHRSLPCLSALALLSGSALAQIGNYDPEPLPGGLAGSYLTGSSSTLKRLFPADLDGNGRMDLVLREDTSSIWIHDPGFYDANSAIAGPAANGIPLTGGAVAPPAAVGGPDRFVGADANGLTLYTWNQATFEFDDDVLTTSTIWQNATRLMVGTVYNQGNPEHFVVGFRGGGTTQLALMRDIDGVQIVNALPAPGNGNIQDVAVLDYDSVAGDEMFVGTLTGVYRLAPSGGQLYQAEATFTSTATHLEPLIFDGALDQLVVGYTPNGATEDRVRVMDAADGPSTDLTLPDGQHLADMASGDLDGDGLPDLAVSYNVLDDLTYFSYDDSGSGTNWANPFSDTPQTSRSFNLVPNGASTSGVNEAGPAIIDADGDGDNDLLFPLQTGRHIALLSGDEFDLFDQAIDFLPNATGTPFVGTWWNHATGEEDTLAIQIDLSSLTEPDFEWAVWYMADTSVTDVSLPNDPPVYEFDFTMDAVAKGFGQVTPGSTDPFDLVIQVEHDFNQTEAFFIEVRSVDDTGAGYDAVEPTIAFAFSLNGEARSDVEQVYGLQTADWLPIVYDPPTTPIPPPTAPLAPGGGIGQADATLTYEPDDTGTGVLTKIPRTPPMPPNLVPDKEAQTL